MAAAAPNLEDNRVLAALAAALVDKPRATLQELAAAIGVSKATLYRFCRTREQLVEQLIHHSIEVFDEAILSADLESAPPLEALSRLIAANLEHRELTTFLVRHWEEMAATGAQECGQGEAALDAFFLRGQQQGVFRIDIGAAALTEIWTSILIGLVEAERRGRVARAGLAALVERAFLQGAQPE